MIQNEPDLAIIVDSILAELVKAERMHKRWPEDVIHAASIVGEESGELTRAAIRWTYESGEYEELETEATQTAAMAIRFLLNLPSAKRIKTYPPG